MKCVDTRIRNVSGDTIYLLKAWSKVNYKNSRKRCEMCSKLTIKTPERRQGRRSGVFVVSFEHISHLFVVFPLLTLSMYLFAGFIMLIAE